jgi:hypothetical protein
MGKRFKLLSPDKEREVIYILDRMLGENWRIEEKPPKGISSVCYLEDNVHVFTQQMWTVVDLADGCILISSSSRKLEGAEYVIFKDTVGRIPSGFVKAEEALDYYLNGTRRVC